MSPDFPDNLSPAKHAQGIDLKFHLLLRVTLFALIIGVVATGTMFYQTKSRISLHVANAGSTVARLLDAGAAQPRGSFGLGFKLDLAAFDGIDQLLGLCVDVEEMFHNGPKPRRCFGDVSAAPKAIRWALGHLIGPEIQSRGQIRQYPGFKVGEFVVSPNLDSESMALWHQVRTVLGMTVGILVLNLLIYLPVRRALQPTDQILAVIERVEAGDLSARMPHPRLVELHRIAAGFDHLTERLQTTMADQRQLAQRLFAVREEERRYLARELHDEFGQCLTSIGAEAAFIAARARAHHPDLLPAAQSIASVTSHMLKALQGILGQLRPVGLEEFGLRAGLVQLIDGWERRVPACAFGLHIEGEIDDFPDDLTVSVYRIVQESLTNALRHGAPQHVTVSLNRTADRCTLCVEDDGEKREPGTTGSGLGVLGMNERVAALGGQFAMAARSPRGMRVQAVFPAEAMTRSGSDHA